MSFKRKKIRKNLRRALKGKTDAEESVYANRVEINWQENLPIINIYFRGEDVEDAESAPRYLNRTARFEIEVIAEGNDEDILSDALDDLGEQIEAALSVDDSLRGTVDDIYLTSISEQEITLDGSKPIGKMSLVFATDYHEYSPRTTKGQGVGPLDGIEADWQVGHDDSPPDMAENDRAKDILNF